MADYDHIIAAPKNSYIYPKLQAFETNFATLQALGGRVPANLQRSYQAIMRAGVTIEQHLDAGVTVSSDDFDNWLQLTKSFASHLGPLQAAPITQTADNGQAQPSDSFVTPLQQVGGAVSTAIDDAFAELESAWQSVVGLPWGWIALGVGVIVVAPMLYSELAPAPRRRRRSARSVA